MAGYEPATLPGQGPAVGVVSMDSVSSVVGASSAAPSGAISTLEGQDRCTLDEPVMDTVMRDVRSIGVKLKYVMLPQARVDNAKGLRDWDLWGPLFLCLVLGMVLSHQAIDGDQSALCFALVFIIVWLGSGIVTLNALLLKGSISFFQSVCVLGYCLCPLAIAAFCTMLLQVMWLKVVFVSAGFTWATGASVGFMRECLPEDRRALGVYPVWLFYVAIAWMILIS